MDSIEIFPDPDFQKSLTDSLSFFVLQKLGFLTLFQSTFQTIVSFNSSKPVVLFPELVHTKYNQFVISNMHPYLYTIKCQTRGGTNVLKVNLYLRMEPRGNMRDADYKWGEAAERRIDETESTMKLDNNKPGDYSKFCGEECKRHFRARWPSIPRWSGNTSRTVQKFFSGLAGS